jgi:5-methylcytosine-specific restriction enzyme A
VFIVGARYDRSDLLDSVGSKQPQSGIIWGPARDDCVIVTSGGRYGLRMGYADSRLPDGTWLYHGQGEEGDQDPDRFGNLLLIDGERTVLLFSTREPTSSEVKNRQSWAKVYTFEGNFRVAAWDLVVPTQGKRAGNKLIAFRLAPELALVTQPDQGDAAALASQPEDLNLEALRNVLMASPFRPVQAVTSIAVYYLRSEQIQAYAIKRSGGRCECCGRVAPFLGKDGLPFLEVHHIRRLSDGGPDYPTNVAAVCPNCHREAHYGQRAHEVNSMLLEKIRNVEECLSAAQT